MTSTVSPDPTSAPSDGGTSPTRRARAAAPGIARTMLGRPRDWRLPPTGLVPSRRLRPHLGWLGPLVVLASCLAIWPAFAGARGEEGGSVAFGLYIGAVSIVLMAWSFVLAVRARWMEPFFGGMDRIYRAHRWAGALAIPTMFLHTSIEPEIEGGIRGAAESVAESAEGLAGVGEYMLYALVAISLVRWFPYRWWRWTHKTLGIPFAFASWHFYTAEKTYANTSAWGWFFNGVMVAGLAAWVHRVGLRDMFTRGHRYRITRTEVDASTIEIELEPVGRKLDHHAGQFAVLKLDAPGLTEPHVFTIASSPDSPVMRFFIRDLGDWSHKLLAADLVGTTARIEGPYGHFEPVPSSPGRTIWVAGGVGITPFLSQIDALAPGEPGPTTPHLIYCVPDASAATARAALRAAADEGRITLDVVASRDGRRFGPDMLTAALAGHDPATAHVATCGPAGLVKAAASAADRAGVTSIMTEDFDIRSGVGPDLSRQIDRLLPVG